VAGLSGPPAAEKWAANRTTIIGGSPSADFIGGDAILDSPSVISSMAVNRFSRIEAAVFPKALHSTLALFGIFAGCAFLFGCLYLQRFHPRTLNSKQGGSSFRHCPGGGGPGGSAEADDSVGQSVFQAVI